MIIVIDLKLDGPNGMREHVHHACVPTTAESCGGREGEGGGGGFEEQV